MKKISAFLTVLAMLLANSGVYGTTGDITFTVKNADPVVFSHELHTKYRGVKCMACHFDKFAAGTGGFKINKKTLNKRDFCGHCHNGFKSFDQEAQKNCNRCHKK